MSDDSSSWRAHPLLAERRREFLGSPIHALTMPETLALANEAMARRRPLPRLLFF